MKTIALSLLLLLNSFLSNAQAGIVLSGDSATVKMGLVDTSIFSISGASNTVLGLTVYDTNIEVDEDATITNVIGYNTLGNDITIAAAKTVTGTYNLFQDAAKAGAGTYSDGSSTSIWSSNPQFRTDGTNFRLKGNSPAKNAGTDVCASIADGNGDAYDLDNRQVCRSSAPVGSWAGGVETGAYGYVPTGDELLFFKQIGIFK